MEDKKTNLTPEQIAYSKECSDRLVKVMKRLGVSQVAIVDKVSFGTAMVSHYCTGKRYLNAEAIIEFCNALQCQPTEIDPERRIFKLNIHSRSHINQLLDNAPVEKIQLIEQLVAEMISTKAE